MHIRRVGVGSLLALGTVALVSAPSLQAGQRQASQRSGAETSFMGVRLLASYRDVLRKFGQPQEIQLGSPAIPGTGAPPATGGGGGFAAGGGGFAGGMPRMGAPGGRGPGSFASGGAMMPGMGGGSPFAPGGGGPGSFGSGGGMPGFRSGGSSIPGMSGGLPGFSSGGAKRGDGDTEGGSGLPGFPGGASMPGMPGGPMMTGSSGGGLPGSTATQQDSEAGETTWWYNDKKKGVYRAFLFNKDGRVIQIQLFGYKGGERTRKGLGLGSTLGQVIQRYGWSNDGSRTGDSMMMSYGGREKLVFQLSKNQVVAVTLAYVR